MLSDSQAFRDLLVALLPGLMITETPPASGQRVVYFCHFEGENAKEIRKKWGRIVLKASEGITPEQIAYLEKEIEILNSLKSPHYPRLVCNETFTEDPRTNSRLPNRLFVTIEERIESKPLRALMAQYAGPKEAIELLGKMVEALKPLWSHPSKLVHRDLKPENVLIRPDGSIAIIDLGILREEGSEGKTLSIFPVGPCTPKYASPEQARNNKKLISFRSDFFALGVICYELIAGVSPFDAGDVGAILTNVVTLPPQNLSASKKCNDMVSRLVHRLLEKEPYKRHRTIEQLDQEIADVLKTL